MVGPADSALLSVVLALSMIGDSETGVTTTMVSGIWNGGSGEEKMRTGAVGGSSILGSEEVLAAEGLVG